VGEHRHASVVQCDVLFVVQIVDSAVRTLVQDASSDCRDRGVVVQYPPVVWQADQMRVQEDLTGIHTHSS
jgi:hypothetical protein